MALDGAYYTEAIQRRNAAVTDEMKYNHWATRIDKSNRKISRIEAKYADPIDAYDEVEHLVITLGQEWEEFVAVAKSFIQNAASVHILCVACLEAHINMCAEAKLVGKSFEEFDKLSVAGKWLFYPRLIRAGRYDPGQQPFQSFQLLIRRRNALVHYKVQTSYQRYGFQVPDFVERMGMRTSELENSLKAVCGMVTSLAKMERRTLPGWITNEYWGIFDF